MSKAEIEIATLVTTARWQTHYATEEHEQIGIAQGGLAPSKVDRIVSGLPTAFDDAREQVVFELASTLAAPRLVSTGLYRRAKSLLAHAGIVDVAVLIGWFTMVCTTLNAFDVPSNAVGLDQ